MTMSEDRRASRVGHLRGRSAPALAAIVCCLLGSAAGVAQTATGENRFNDALMQLPPQERAGKLADHLGVWCIGTKPFFMGVTKVGAAKGYAYWSITCAGGKSYMIQIAPDGKGAAVDCQTLKQGGEGRECYKTF